LEQSSESYAADKVRGEREREREREREKRKTQNNYTSSFHNLEVVLSPLHFQGEFTKSVSDYNCSSTKAKDFKLLKHKSKRFPMLKSTRKRFPMLKHKSMRLLIKQNYIENCLRF